MSQGLGAYLIRRTFSALIVLFAISILVFLILRLTPTDPVEVLLGQKYDAATASVLREKYGYDESLPIQYVTYIRNLVQGDFGISTRRLDFTANEIVIPRLWVSARLGFFALVIAFGLGIPFGIYTALNRGKNRDPALIGGWLAVDAIPVFVSAPIVQWIFALQLGWVDLSFEGVFHKNIILPVLLIALPGVAGVARFMRASIIQVMSEDYVRTARAKGLRKQTIVLQHITRNALLPVLTVIGLSLPGIFAGSLFVELFWGIPGIARESLDAILANDYDIILGLVLFGSFLFVMVNIFIDVAYGFIDPRVRIGASRGAV